MKQFYKLFREVLQDDRLTRTQKDIISIIFNRAEYYKGKQFYCYESWIASEVKCSEKTVKRAIKHFETLGYININKVYNKKTRKTTNYYLVNFDVMNTRMVEETGTSGVAVEKTEVVNEVVVETAPVVDDMPPMELLYPYEAEYAEALTIPINDFSTPKTEEKVDNEEIVNNVKRCLKKAANKDNKGVVYFPDIMKEFNYKYRDIVEAVKELDKRGELAYTPTEKDGKIYHNYTLSIKGTIKEWEQICEAVYGQSKGDEDYYTKLSMFSNRFIKNGYKEEELVDVIVKVKNKHSNKKAA